jgi:hypothetical protein
MRAGNSPRSRRCAALRDARSLISDGAINGRIMLDQRIQVEDSAGAIVHNLEFCDAVKIDRQS